jgi:hypothetical protein
LNDAMAVGRTLTISIAERIERAVGAERAIAVWKALASNAGSDEVRARALLSAFRCAISARRPSAIDELVPRWREVRGAGWARAVIPLCKSLSRSGEAVRAIALAEAESRRHPTALSLYCYARCLDVARDESSVKAFGSAVERAAIEGDGDIERASRVRRVAIHARSWRTLDDALQEANRLELGRLSTDARITIARVLLLSPSRFVRATGLGLLDDVVISGEASVASKALRVVAEWIDAVGGAMTPLEADRVLAVWARERAVAVAPNARAVARAVLASAPQYGRMLEAMGAPNDKLRYAVLDEACTNLASDDAAAHVAAARVIATHLQVPSPFRPRAGYVALGHRLTRLGMKTLAVSSYRAARAAREPGATEALASSLADLGRTLAHEGQRAAAIAHLREAKQLLTAPVA